MGGVAAYATANALVRTGHTVDFIVMFDTSAPIHARLHWRARWVAQHMRTLSTADKARFVVQRIRVRITRARQKAARPSPAAASSRRAAVDRLKHSHRRAFAAYRPESSDLEILLFAAEDSTKAVARELGPTLGWDRFVSRHVAHYVVPGSHLEAVSDTSLDIADPVLRRYLAR
jgi:thioesterase domain-containing protein